NPQLWRPLGDLGQLVQNHMISLATRGSFLLEESVRRRLAELRLQLTTSGNDPLADFLIQRVLISFLEVEIRQLQALHALGEPMNRKQQRRLDQAQRRHVESIKAL